MPPPSQCQSNSPAPLAVPPAPTQSGSSEPCYTCIARLPCWPSVSRGPSKNGSKNSPAALAAPRPYVREAILEHLDDLEDMYLAERVLERIRSGEEQTIPLEDALKRHGLED